MYNNGRVAAIHYNSFRQISHTDVYLIYETIAGRKKNEQIGHYQAIVKGPHCPTNITPGQNQHVPQANNKPPLSTEACNQNPDNQHDEDDDDEDIFANLTHSTNAKKTKGCCRYLPQANI